MIGEDKLHALIVSLSPEEKAAFQPLPQRRAAADALGIPLKKLNAVLWRNGLRWDPQPRRTFTKRGMRTDLASGVSALRRSARHRSSVS
jgi:hypothetical protein